MKSIKKNILILIVCFFVQSYESRVFCQPLCEITNKQVILSNKQIEKKDAILLYKDERIEIISDWQTILNLDIEDMIPNYKKLLEIEKEKKNEIRQDEKYSFGKEHFGDLVIKRVLSSGSCIVYSNKKRIRSINKATVRLSYQNGYTLYIIDNICVFGNTTAF